MPSSTSDKESTSYGLIVFLIITLFLCGIFFYVRNNKEVALVNEIDQLANFKEDYSQIDSCIIILNNANNNSKLYTISGENKYIKDFSSDINTVSDILYKINDLSKDKYVENLNNLTDQKKTRTQINLKLRQLTDALLLNNEEIYKSNTQYANINFRNSYNLEKTLKSNELVILKLNTNIIKDLVTRLKEYKIKEKNFAFAHKMEIKATIDQSIKSIEKIYLLRIGLLIVLLITILYNLWKIYRNENKLIKYGYQASQYAISKSRFLANMSHEIRTPLNSVIGFSEQLSQSELNDQQVQQVTAIRSSSVMLLDVVNEILDFSKYETGKVSFDDVPFMPFDAINEVLHSIAIQATQKDILLKNEISFQQNLCFSGDSLRLKQVIINLLSNAIKFTDRGSVTLKAEAVNTGKKNSLLKIQIIDTGIGIATEDIKIIFDEFAQVYNSAAKIKQKGTGLGLAICKKIVEFQGGQIDISSELGVGSVFSFEIPYKICLPESVLENKNVNLTKGEDLEGKRILLADDNKMNILLAQTVLKKYKFKIDVAYDGKEAFDLFENNTYDLILTDIQMPEMGGEELTRTIRAYHDQNKVGIPILGVTANVLKEDREKYIESGINDLVLKPFSEKELIDKIIQYII